MLPVYFSLGILAVLFLVQLMSHRTYRSYKTYRIVFWTVCGAVLLYYFYLVYTQYLAWRDGGELLQRLVPPYGSITYVFGYHFTRFALYYLVSFLVAILFLYTASYFNKKYGYLFFENEEPYLGAIAVFLLGLPLWRYAWIYYLIAVLAVAVIGSLVMNHLLKKSERFSLRYLWLPAALSVIIVLILLY